LTCLLNSNYILRREKYAPAALGGGSKLIGQQVFNCRKSKSMKNKTLLFILITFILLKMALLGLVLLLEVWPMVTLIRWRIQLARGEEIDTRPASRFALISAAQTMLVIAIAFAATAMARGIGV
jgi:hypothetical protein